MKLEDTLRVLYDEGVEFVLIGGAAMQLQGSAYITEDLDFCYARSARNFHRLAKALHQVLSVAGLIQAKRAAGRDKDLQALKELEGLLDFRKRSGL